MKTKFASAILFIILVCTLLISSRQQATAQVMTNYAVTNTTGTFTVLSGATIPGLTTGTTDDGTISAIPIGFDFWYMGIRYTTISSSTNGWLTFGSTIQDIYTNSLSASGTRPVIAPLWDDLDIASASNVSYKTAGATGSRIFTIQYLNVKWDYQNLGSAISFQVNLYESTGRVEFIYRPESSAVTTPSASIGISATATGAGNFLSVSNAGTSASSTTEQSVTTKPISGKTYRFTSPVPAAPATLIFSNVTGTSMTLSWTDNSTNEMGFVIYRSTDGVNYTFVSQTAAAATTSVQSGLTAGITYYWKVFAVTEGGLSTALSGSNVAACTGPSISRLPAANLIAYYKFEGNANDATGNNNGMLQGIPAITTDRFNNAGKAYLFSASQYIATVNAYVNPVSTSTSVWFKTTTNTGGALLGFSSVQTGPNGNRDRFIYMTNTGIIYTGTAPGAVKKYLSSTLSYNDGTWHMATSTTGASGLKLYIDGNLIASDPTVTSGETITGYWRIGYSDLSTWPNEPSSYYFSGTLDDAVIYHRELTAAEVTGLYNSPDGAGNNSPVCAGSTLSLTATTVSGATYSWTGPNGFTSALQNPTLTYTSANAGIYTVSVNSAGCSTPSVAYTNVTSTGSAGQWTGNISTDWANPGNWCSGVLPTSATNVIIATGATRMPSVITTAVCNNLTINSGATLTTATGGTLNVAGTLTNNGTMTNSGTVNFNGTSGQQTFTGISQFYNLTLTNTSGLLLPAAITIANTLTLTSGTLTTNNFNVTVAGNWVNNVSATALAAGTSAVTFNGTTAQSIGGSFATTFNNLVISNTGNTVTLLANANISGNLTVSAGTFDLGAFTANRTVTGGNLSVSNNSTLKIGGTNTFPANYTTNTLVVASTVEYSGTNQTVSNQTYGNLTLSSSSGAAVKTFPATALAIIGNLTTILGSGTSVSFTAGSNITVSGNIVLAASTTFLAGSFTHSIGGNWTNNGTFTGNTSTIIFTGSGSSVGGTGIQNFNNLTIAASSITFTNSTITLTGNLATTGSGAFTQASGGTLTMSGTGTTISGTGISPDNLNISGTVTTASTLNLTGNLIVGGSFSASAGTLTMSGTTKSISGAGTISLYILSAPGTITTSANFSIASSLNVSGTFTATAGTATFTGSSSLSGTANLFNTTINGTSLLLTANSILGVANALTLTAGILDVTTSLPNTVNFNGSGAQFINGITYNNLSLATGGNKTAAAAFTANNNFTIGSGTTFLPGAFTHTLYTDWVNNGTFTAGTSTILFAGSATSNIIGTTTFNTLTVNNTTAATAVVLQSSITAATINMTLGTLFTGANTLNITTTRTGNGIILGTIKRTHTFSANIAYAFESPNNTVTFTSISGVTSVTVNVTKGVISDFPFGGSISRLYNITVPSGTYAATLRLHYEDNELNGNNEATMALWNYNGTTWNSAGKTTSDAGANYVEQALLSNISTRWTLSDNSNVVRWNGSVSTDWNTAANWTVQQGSASSPPGANDIVNLGTAAFTYQPAISSAVTVKNIVFGSVQAVNLTMATGGSLTTGAIQGTWAGAAGHNINVNNQNITINGDLGLSDGTTGHYINLNIGTGTVNIIGSLTQSADASIVFTGAGTLNIYQNFNYTSGTFTPGTGTVGYNGSANQIIGPVPYYNLTINKASGLAVINSAITAAGNLAIQAGELDNLSTFTILGNVTLSSGAIFKNNGILNIGGNWNNNGTYIVNGGSITFNGSATQTISASIFNNLTIDKPVGISAVLTGNLIIQNNLTIVSGTLDIGTYTSNRATSGGVATIQAAGTLIIGANNTPGNFTAYNLLPASTTIYNGTVTQVISMPGITFGNLIFRNAGAKSLSSAINISGDLTIETGSNLDAGSQTIALNGNWTNSGTFTSGTSTVLLTGASKTITGNTTFSKVTISGIYVQTTNITYNDLLTVTASGSVSSGTGIFTTVNGDLVNMGILNTSGTATFTGLRLQTISLINAVTTFVLTVNFNGTVSPVLNSTSVPQFGFLNINNTGGVYPSVGWTIAYSLVIGPGASFNGGPSAHYILGAVNNTGTITSSGTLNFIPTATALVNLGSIFSSTGTVVFGGAGAMTLSGSPTGFNDVLISNTHTSGITPASNWHLSNNFTITNNAAFHASSYIDSIGGNILNNGTMDPGTSTFVINGTGNQTISTGVFNNMTINKSAGTTTLLNNASVNGTLNFTAGNITTGSNLLSQSASGTVSGAAQNTGWVFGNLRKNIGTGATIKAYEIGDNSNYTPLTLVFANVSTAGDLAAITTPGDHPAINTSTINQAKSVNRYWSLTNSGIAFTNFAVTLNFKIADIDAGASSSLFKIGVYNGSAWSAPTATTTNTTNTTAAGMTSLGDFALGEVCNAGTSIAYTSSPYCTAAGTATVTLTGTSGGNYSSTSGLTIDVSTGNIDLSTSTAGTYTVTYTIAASGSCGIYSTSANITVTKAPQATISYTGSPYLSTAGTASVTSSGTQGGTYSSTAGLSINTATGDVNLSASTEGTYVVTYTIPAAGGCSIYTTMASITLYTYKTWDGGAGTNNWGDANNWSPDGVPVASDNINLTGANVIGIDVINAMTNNLVLNNSGLVLTVNQGNSLAINGSLTLTAGTMSTVAGLTGAITVANNITVAAAGSLTINTTLKTGGSINNTGVLTATNGTIEMNGLTAQAISASTFTGNTIKNFTVNNSAGVNLNGSLNISGIVLAANGQLSSGGYLTLLSTALQTALIDGSGTGSVTGNLTMQRYLGAGFGYKYFSSPFQDATVNAFSSTVDLVAAFPSFYTYLENKASSGWTAYTTSTNPLNPLQGYAADFGSATAQKLVSITGTVSNNSLAATLQNTNQPFTLGFNLVGNPYPSPVDWNATTGWTKTNIDNAIYFFDSGTTSQYTGSYCSYINGVSSDGIANNIIASMQGFFVHVSNGTYPVTATLGVNNAVRVNNLNPVFHKSSDLKTLSAKPRILLRLSAGFSDLPDSSDPLVIYTQDEAAAVFDKKLDAIKLMNTNDQVPNLYSTGSDATRLAINAIPAIDINTVIPLVLQTGKNGVVNFNMRNIENLPADLRVYLHDDKNGTNQVLQENTKVSFSLNSGNYENRFSLRFGLASTIVTPVSNADIFQVYTSDKIIMVKIALEKEQQGKLIMTNMIGQVLSNQKINGNGTYEINISAAGAVYVISFISPDSVHSKKIFFNNQ
jgi:hypothetical protein